MVVLEVVRTAEHMVTVVAGDNIDSGMTQVTRHCQLLLLVCYLQYAKYSLAITLFTG